MVKFLPGNAASAGHFWRALFEAAVTGRRTKSAANGTRIVRLSAFGLIVTLLLIIVVLANRYYQQYREALHQHEMASERAAEKLLLYTESVFDHAMVLIRTIAQEPDPQRRLTRDSCRGFFDPVDQPAGPMSKYGLGGIALVDRYGMLSSVCERNTGWRSNLSVDLSDRHYFSRLRDNPAVSYVITPPIANRLTGMPYLFMAHRLTGPAGEFAGVVLAAIDPEGLRPFLKALSAPEAAIAVEKTPVLIEISPDLQGSGLFRDVLAELFGVTSASPDATRTRTDAKDVVHLLARSDGTAWILAKKYSEGYGVTVVAGFSRDQALEDFRRDRRKTLLFISLLVASYLIFGTLLIERIRRIAKLSVAAEKARFEAEEANRTKSRFLAHMSHELRTPMNAIMGFGEIMAREVFGQHVQPKYREYSESILASATHLYGIIDHLIDLADISSGKWTPNNNEFDVRALLSDAEALSRGRAAAAGVTLEFESVSGDTRFRADRRLLLQIVFNLLGVAIGASVNGGIVRVVALRRTDGGMDLTIAGQGISLPLEECEDILSPFHGPADLARTQSTEMGFALALCRRLAELQAAAITIAGGPEKGAIMTISFPSTPDEESAA